MSDWARFRSRLLWHSGATLIGYVTILHISWAILIQVSGDAMHTTPLSLLGDLLGPGWLLSLLLICAAAGATLGALAPHRILGLALMLPQQTILLIVACGAGQAVAMGAYPDGTIRWWPFILTDQFGIILLAPAYTVAVLTFHNVWRRNGRRMAPSEIPT